MEQTDRQTDGRIAASLNPLMHKVAKMVTYLSARSPWRQN